MLALGDAFHASLALVSLLFRTGAGLSGCCPAASQLRSGPLSLLRALTAAQLHLIGNDTAGRLEAGALVCAFPQGFFLSPKSLKLGPRSQHAAQRLRSDVRCCSRTGKNILPGRNQANWRERLSRIDIFV